MSIVYFPDARAEVLRVIRAAVETYPALSGLASGTRDAEDLGPSFPGLPYVRVTLDNTDSSQWPFMEVSYLRANVSAPSESECLCLAQVVRGVLLSYEGDAQIRSIRPGGGPGVEDDPDALPPGDKVSNKQQPFAYFTFSMRLGPEVL